MPALSPSRWIAGAAAALSLGGLASACQPAAGGFCDKICDCVDCFYYRDMCVQAVKQARAVAGDAGCGSQFDGYLSCTVSQITCDGSTVGLAPGCDAERAALLACDSVEAMSCELTSFEVLRHNTECGVAFDVGYGPIGCDPYYYGANSECYSQCLIDASCAALSGQDPAGQEEINLCSEQCF